MPLILAPRTLRTADHVAWQGRAACNGHALDADGNDRFIPDGVETEDGLEAARIWCDPCPVRQDCLMWAMLYRAEGYWGGTNTHQRAQALRKRTRAKCFICACESLVYYGEHELCLACGMSWVRDVRLEPIAATPLPSNAA